MGTQKTTGELATALAGELGCAPKTVEQALGRLGIELRRAPVYPDKPCRGCGKLFSPRAPSHLFCAACNQVTP
jgi:hypothetical protein